MTSKGDPSAKPRHKRRQHYPFH